MSIDSYAKARLRHCKKAHLKIDIILKGGEIKYIELTDDDIRELRKQTNDFVQYVHELNAYRNVHLNNKKGN